ncbi:MAG: hypothetical protein IJW31_06585 [Lentisphaeria bacterium]|nr:hypothetical protein [Lentisphaeria bacterium]
MQQSQTHWKFAEDRNMQNDRAISSAWGTVFAWFAIIACVSGFMLFFVKTTILILAFCISIFITILSYYYSEKFRNRCPICRQFGVLTIKTLNKEYGNVFREKHDKKWQNYNMVTYLQEATCKNCKCVKMYKERKKEKVL